MKLKELRQEAGLTLTELAKRSANDQTFLSRIERGERSLTVERALRIAAVLSEALGRRVTVEDVFGHPGGADPQGGVSAVDGGMRDETHPIR